MNKSVIILLIFIIPIESINTPRFFLDKPLSKSSTNEVPRLSIIFPDGHRDKLILKRYKPNQFSESDECYYNGHLKNEPDACVAMTGIAL